MSNARNLANLLNTDTTIATGDVADGGITTAKLADDAVTSAKLDTNIAVSGTLGVTGAFTSRGIDDNADATAITIDSSEHVGIGTASPDGTLHVHSASAGSVTALTDADDFVVENSGHGGISILTPDANRSALFFGHASDNLKLQIRHDGGTSLSQFISDDAVTFNVGDGSERLRIDSSGNVGIGNSNPSSFNTLADNLVVGTTSGENGITIASGSNNSGRFVFSDNTTSSADAFVGAIEYAHSNNHMFFYTAGTQQLKITNNGFMQSPPTAGNTTSASSNMHVTAGGEFAKSTSSERYKNTINDATHGLAELLKLRSVTYKGNNDGDTIFGGLIAEEVHEVGLTEFVVYDEEDRPDALHYPHMIALCVKAIQELKTELDSAKARITVLEGE